jgi:hypothetical protein
MAQIPYAAILEESKMIIKELIELLNIYNPLLEVKIGNEYAGITHPIDTTEIIWSNYIKQTGDRLLVLQSSDFTEEDADDDDEKEGEKTHD